MLDLIYRLACDFVLAEDLHAEEVLRFATHPESFCAVCKLPIPSLEASWKPDNCDHVLCIACLWQFAPETTTGLPQCAVASCESSKSETHQGVDAVHRTLIPMEDMDNGKGKEPLDVMLQEPGQCSRGADTTDRSEFYCTMCMETVHVREVFLIPGCTHLFCVSCLSQYITAKVEDKVLSIGCPEPRCKDGVLDPEACRDLIPLQLFQRWDAELCDSILGATKLYCPFKDCSALMVNEHGPREATMRKAECPYCSRMFCVQCKVAWHYGATCEDFQLLGDDQQRHDDMLLSKVDGSKRLGNDQQRHDDMLLRKVDESKRLWNDQQRHDDMLLRKVHESKWQRCLRSVVARFQTLCKSKANQQMDSGHSALISTEDMGSRKGKDPLYDVLQDLGQCSIGLNEMASYEFYCTICMETVHLRELFPISGCTHLFCVSCVSQYITAKVEDNVLSIGCPDPGCKYGALDPEACRDVIPVQLFERWGAALCDLALGRFKFYCPFNDCSALLVHELGHGEAAITQTECPHCRRMFCAQCKVEWHDGMACAEFQRLGKDERGKNDLLLRKIAQKSRWQRCPKCKMYVERAEGCVYIVCRCQHRFCYLCASPMSKGIHRCSKCKRTW